MKIEQLYEKCLSQASYFIADNGEAAVIDPLRDTDLYIQLAKEEGAQIKYIFETHFHADFVSGHLDLAEKTGATIVFGPGAATVFTSFEGKDGERFNLGDVTIELLHTPGHTLESTCFLLRDSEGNPNAVFTGDTLFIGDVGRPDLAQSDEKGLTMQGLAGMLFDSLRNKLMLLPNHITVYPGHGAGSACGKNMSKETFSTLGEQKETNYALSLAISKEKFVNLLCEDLQAPPTYFPMNASLNAKGYPSLENIIEDGLKALNVQEFNIILNKPGTILLDTRTADDFAKYHIPGSLNIGISGGFAPWVGTLIPIDQQRILIISETGKEEEVIRRLARVGYNQSVGYLNGGIEAWKEAGGKTGTVLCLTAAQFIMEQGKNQGTVLDVRTPGEFKSGHIKGAINLPLNEIPKLLNTLDGTKNYLVYCAGGYRSMIFMSILQRSGIYKSTNVDGGYAEISKLI